MLRALAAVVLGASACSVGCGPSGRPVREEVDGPATRWVVIAPHPDDETLIASGILLRAAQSGSDPAVIVMTNGDLDCIHDGLRREGESIAAMAELGVREERVFFLGYPDGGLAQLGRAPLPPRRRIIDGSCQAGNTTYGARGFGRHDYHRVRFGAEAPYTRENAVADLAALLAELHPTDVAITHPEDTHPDHAATYTLFRSALDRLAEAPRVHRAMVHNGDCWPTGTAPREPCPAPRIAPGEPTPPLSGRLTGYVPGERFAVPSSCLAGDPESNPKLRAIAAHASQTRGTLESYLFAFARSDEVFFPERFARSDRCWSRTTTAPPARRLTTQTLKLERDDEERVLPLAAPLVVSASLARPPHDEHGSVARFDLLEDRAGSYELSIDAERREASLVRTFESGPPEVLRTWLLPHDLWASAEPERIDLAIDPRPEDGSVAELSLRWRGELVGVAVDVHPKLRGDRIGFTNVVAAGGELTVRGVPNVSASPSARPAR